jgi:hypothetical protein
VSYSSRSGVEEDRDMYLTAERKAGGTKIPVSGLGKMGDASECIGKGKYYSERHGEV